MASSGSSSDCDFDRLDEVEKEIRTQNDLLLSLLEQYEISTIAPLVTTLFAPNNIVQPLEVVKAKKNFCRLLDEQQILLEKIR